MTISEVICLHREHVFYWCGYVIQLSKLFPAVVAFARSYFAEGAMVIITGTVCRIPFMMTVVSETNLMHRLFVRRTICFDGLLAVMTNISCVPGPYHDTCSAVTVLLPGVRSACMQCPQVYLHQLFPFFSEQLSDRFFQFFNRDVDKR